MKFRENRAYQPATKFMNNPELALKSHEMAVLTIDELLSKGVSLEDFVRHAIPKLSIKRLERLETLIRRVLVSKHATQARYSQEGSSYAV